jgi:glucokinase
MSATSIGIDIGGTKLAAGLVDDRGTVVARARRVTPAREPARIPDLIAEVVADLDGPPDLPIGVGAAGIIDSAGVMRYAPNIDWRDYPLGETLRARFPTTVVTVDNDANVAAWAEYRAGAGSDAGASMVMLTVGTGVGGGLVMGGQLVRGAAGLGAEFGHIIVTEGGPRCSCGNRGCLEAVASGTAIGRSAREELTAGQIPDSSPLAGSAPDEITGKSVTVAAQGGDEFAVTVLARAGFWLGVGIASLVNALDPELVVVGGGAMEAGDLLLDPATAAFEPRLMGREHRTLPPVRPARLGDDAGVIGAALLARDRTGAPAGCHPTDG